MHGLLVGLGALLLAVAAVGFLVFSWRVLSLSGRATVIAVATLGVLSVASWLRARLPETAEAVGALGVVLVLADSWAIRRTGLFGADRPDGLEYAAAAAAVCALLLGGWALLSRVRAGSWAAVLLAPLAVLLLTVRLDGELGPVPVFGTGLVLIAGLALGRGLLPNQWRAERRLLQATAAGALFSVGGSAGLGVPGPGRAAIVLVGAAVLAGAQARVDRPSALLPAANSLFLRRAWSLAAGLLAGAAALQAGLALKAALGLDGVSVLIPVTALPALAVLAAAAVPFRPGATFRRTAFGAGTVSVAAVVAAAPLGLAGWLLVRAVLAGTQAWSAEPGTRFGDLDPQSGGTTASWAVALIGLALVGVCAVLAARTAGWPGWLRRPVRAGAALAGGLGLIVLPLLPVFPVVAVVAGLILLSVLAATLAAALMAGSVAGPVGARSLTVLVAGWTTSALTGTLAVLVAWSCRELSVPVTALGIAGLLLARRQLPMRTPGPGAAPLAGHEPALLAALAGAAAPFAVAAAAGLAGAPGSQRVVWAGLVGGLSAAALIGLPRWIPPGRARWNGSDRLAAATPGVIALLAGLLATLPDEARPGLDAATWPRPALLAVALLVALIGAVAVRPAVALTLPVLPPACAVAVTPLLGALAAAVRAAVTTGDPERLMLSLLWAVAAAVGAFVTAAVVLSGRADPIRRLAAEFGVIGTGVIGLTLINGLDAVWPALLVLGAAAAAIAATPDRQRIGWLAGLLLTGSTWSRLAVGHVTLVEAYSVPPALALLVLAGYRFYRARGRATGEPDPMAALLPVATVGLAPSILVATQGPALRPLLLIGIGAALVLSGWWGQRRGRLPLGAALAAIGVLTAAGTAVLRAGSTLWSLPDEVTASLSGVEVWTGPAALVLLFAGLARLDVLPLPADLPVPADRPLSADRPAPADRLALGRAATPPVLAALLLAGVPSLIAALRGVTPYTSDGTAAGTVVRVGAVLALSMVAALAGIADRRGADRFRSATIGPATIGPASIGPASIGPATIGLLPGAIALAAAASWGGVAIGAGPIEVWTLPLAALLLIHGWSRFDRIAAGLASGELPAGGLPFGGLPASWPAYAPGLVVLLLPSLLIGFGPEGSPGREIALIALAGATLVVGVQHRLQAPVLLGAAALLVQAVVLLVPWVAELSGTVPLWGWLAAVGLGLILLGARYEARMRQFRMVRLRLAALR